MLGPWKEITEPKRQTIVDVGRTSWLYLKRVILFEKYKLVAETNAGISCLIFKKSQHNDLGRLNINTICNFNSVDFQTAANSSIIRLISLPAPC